MTLIAMLPEILEIITEESQNTELIKVSRFFWRFFQDHVEMEERMILKITFSRNLHMIPLRWFKKIWMAHPTILQTLIENLQAETTFKHWTNAMGMIQYFSHESCKIYSRIFDHLDIFNVCDPLILSVPNSILSINDELVRLIKDRRGNISLNDARWLAKIDMFDSLARELTSFENEVPLNIIFELIDNSVLQVKNVTVSAAINRNLPVLEAVHTRYSMFEHYKYLSISKDHTELLILEVCSDENTISSNNILPLKRIVTSRHVRKDRRHQKHHNTKGLPMRMKYHTQQR